MDYEIDKSIYQNDFYCKEDIKDFILEGEAVITFENNRMRMENRLSPELGQTSNYVFWCPISFPDNVMYTWEFYPISEPGLAMFFFSAEGKNGEDIFDSRLIKRDGQYGQYHSSDINTLHASYFRRKYEVERAFHTCNLRKSCGFHLVSLGADPIPSVCDAVYPYNIKVIKAKENVLFYVNDLLIYRFTDDNLSYGAVLSGGKAGFRQMAPLIAEYSNFKVYSLKQKRF